jgi:cytochrome c oxidase subunit 4
VSDQTKHRESTVRTYIAVWAALLVLTAITVTTASLDLGKIAIIVVLAIAAIKSSLVVLYFMHLRHEKRVVIKILIPIAIALLAIFIGLTYSDIMNR